MQCLKDRECAKIPVPSREDPDHSPWPRSQAVKEVCRLSVTITHNLTSRSHNLTKWAHNLATWAHNLATWAHVTKKWYHFVRKRTHFVTKRTGFARKIVHVAVD